MTKEERRFPIGRFHFSKENATINRKKWIAEIAAFPRQIREAVSTMNAEQLARPYREGGWTVRQVVHHVADSHMNAYIRFKLALTEESPKIKPYFEDRWAELADTFETPIEVSINLLEALHQRWVILLENMTETDFQKIFIHPEHGTSFTLEKTVAIYAWHGKHHLGHIHLLK